MAHPPCISKAPTGVPGDAKVTGSASAAAAARRVLDDMAGQSGHIFNLGHGIRLGTDPEVVGSVVDAVRRHDG